MRLNTHITHTQRHINKAWSEMFSCSSCFAFYCFSSFPWFIETIWDNFYPSWTNVVVFFQLYCFLYIFHYNFIDYEQSNALPSTIPFSITFLLTTSNLMLHLQHSHFTSNSRLVMLLNFLISHPYLDMISHCHKFPYVMPNCFIPTQRSFQYCHMDLFLTVLRENVVLPPFVK